MDVRARHRHLSLAVTVTISDLQPQNVTAGMHMCAVTIKCTVVAASTDFQRHFASAGFCFVWLLFFVVVFIQEFIQDRIKI